MKEAAGVGGWRMMTLVENVRARHQPSSAGTSPGWAGGKGVHIVPTKIIQMTRANTLSGLVVRVLVAAAGLTAAWAGGSADVATSIYAAAAYAVFAAGFWLTSPWQPRWAAAPVAVVDTVAVSAFVWTAPITSAGWVLLLFPAVLAAAAGIVPALFAGALAVAAYLGILYSTGQTLDPLSAWPIGVIVCGIVAAALFQPSWIQSAGKRRALVRAATMREQYVRERALARIAGDLASLDITVIEQALLRAASEGLRATCHIEEVDKGLLIRRKDDARPGDAARDLPRTNVGLNGRVLSVVRESPLTGSERAWLERLGAAGEAALRAAVGHGQLAAGEARLRLAWHASPPAVLKTTSGDVVEANDGYWTLGLDAAQPTPSLDAVEQEEVSTGDPPRTFIVTKADLNLDIRLTTYREVTREREALQARDELLSLVGHELRAPLTSIHGFSQMMARNLDVVRQQATQLDRLIGDLMSQSALQRGQLSLDLQRVDLSELVKEAAERFRVAVPERQIELHVQSGQEIRADPARLNQVLDNLLNNAAKYSAADAPIDLGLERRQGEAVLWVRDHGAGIAPEHLERLFQRFYRTPAAERKEVKGLGLGLAVVRDLVTAHGGRVWAESAGVGRGSTFFVSLPVDPGTSESGQAARSEVASR